MSAQPKLKSRYEIKDVLGQGGMGVVYRASDTVIQRDVALKTLRDKPDPAALETFQKECGVLATLAHPNIIEIFDLGEFEEDGTSKPYFVMPLLPGVTLETLLRTSSQRLTVERAVEIICQTCRGLQAAHERGLVHRDLKPSNIFVMEDDSVKIIDFGVAHIVDARTTMSLKGTLAYMAPEQIQMKPLSALSDIFSLGVVAYETLALHRPFQGRTQAEMVDAILHHIPSPVSDLNPTVSPLISRVVHKALAKQPFYRFGSAKELADSLQKALRNEPIDFLDPARIQPRIERASRAFEQGDYQFAAEILGELEAEGHMDPAMSALHRQINQTLRQRTMKQLLQSARTRIEEKEFPLALQKIMEVLQLDPENAEALSLKNSLEHRRTEDKVEDWLRLARQHVDHCAFDHARTALQNVLQVRPKDTQALQLWTELGRREQEHLKLRQQKQDLYHSALRVWENGDVSAALSKLQGLLELDRKAPDLSSDSATAYQNFYNQVRTQHDAIKNAYAEARQRLTERDFAAALRICDDYLGKYPSQALFQALKFEVEEQQRQEVSSQIAEINRKVEAEPDLDRRVAILKEAVDLHPGEGFEPTFRLMKEKRDLVNSIVTKARLLEEQGLFNEALGQWEILQTIHNSYPGLQVEMERVVKRREQQQRAAAQAYWVEQIDLALESGGFARAKELLAQAQGEFPQNAELEQLEKLVEQGAQRAVEAERLLAEGQQLCTQQETEAGLDLLARAHQLDGRNPLIKAVLVNTLLEEARARLERDWRTAEPLIQQALDLEPGSSLGLSLKTLAADSRREGIVTQCLTQARQSQTAGDLESALRQVEQGLHQYPGEFRLTQLLATLTRSSGETRRHTTFEAKPRSEILATEEVVAPSPDRGPWGSTQNQTVVSSLVAPAGHEAPLEAINLGGESPWPDRVVPEVSRASQVGPATSPRPRIFSARWSLPAVLLLLIALGLGWSIRQRARASAVTTPPVSGAAPMTPPTAPEEARVAAPTLPPSVQPIVDQPDSLPGATKAKGTGVRSGVLATAPRLAVETAPVPLSLTGVLQLKRSPANVQVVLQSDNGTPSRTVTEEHLELPEGAYVLTATAPGYNKLSLPIRIEAGKPQTLDLSLQPFKITEREWKTAWENPTSWTSEGDWLVHRGGEFVLSTIQPEAGSYAFTLWRKGKNLQWVVNFTDEKNFELFELDKKRFLHSQVRNGKRNQLLKVPHGLDKQSYYSLQMTVTSEGIIHRIHDGQKWQTLDDWKGAGSGKGKFGFYVPGKDQMGLSHFTYAAH